MKRKKIIIIVLLAVQVLLVLLYFFSPNYIHTSKLLEENGKYTVGYQLTSQDVTAFGQGTQKAIWIGTSDGLNLYNGSTYIQLLHDEGDTTSLPDNNIQCIHLDLKGDMWVGTHNGLAKSTGAFRFQRYYIPYSTFGITQIADAPDSSIIVNNGIAAYIIKDRRVRKLCSFKAVHMCNRVYSDGREGYWIIQPNNIIHSDKQSKILSNWYFGKANLSYTYLYKDSLWFSQGQRLTGLNIKTGKVFYTYPHLDILPTEIYTKGDSRVFLNSGYHGLYMLDTKTNIVSKITEEKIHLNHKDVTISSIFEDANHNTWIGFQNGGFQIMPRSRGYYTSPLSIATKGMNVNCVSAVADNVIGGMEEGLFCYDLKRQQIRTYHYYDIFNDSPVYRQVVNDIIPYGEDGLAWIITQVRIFSGRVHDGSVELTQRAFGNDNLGPLLGTGIRLGDRVLVTSDSPYLISCKYGSNRPDSIPVGNARYDKSSKLIKMRDGKVLVIMRGMQLAVYDPQYNKVEQLSLKNNQRFLDLSPNTALIDSYNRIWVGTHRNGLYRLDYAHRELLPDSVVMANDIETLVEGRRGELWISTRRNLIKYNPGKRSVLYSTGAWQPQNDVNRQVYFSSGCVAGNDVVYGTSNGCLSIPLNRQEDMSKQYLRIVNIKIKNSEGKDLSVNEHIPAGAHYTFSADNNNLTVDFSGNDFGNRRMLYQTKLDGLNDWQAPTLSPTVIYNGLKPGKYTLHVRTILSTNLPPLGEVSIHITIRPHWWASSAAIYFYLLCAFMLVWYANHLYLRSRSNALKLGQMQHERELDKRTNEMNMSFFANISHEFRNPLTIIAGPLMVLRDDKALPPKERHLINVVCKSVNRMLRLIDQMLDFNQLETDALRLRVAQYDIANELQSIVATVGETTRLRGIHLQTVGLNSNVYGWMDKDKLEKIMSNLLTNALKHVADGGTIRVSLTTGEVPQQAEMARHLPGYTGRYISVSVFNDGPLIADDKLPYVFQRYYQARDTGGNHQYGWGTGIGLYYAKRQTELHHGDIWVRNEPEGGVTFRFVLPIDEQVYHDSEHVQKDEGIMQIPVMQEDAETEDKVQGNQQEVNVTAKKPVVMIVDDDTDVAQYMRSLFSGDYVVVNKYSAEAALADMEAVKPDIILSDVVMGDMDGYEFCRKVKGNLMFSHIPLILITAKSNIDEQVQGLQTGADAYVTKPFDPRYLMAMVRNQLDRVAKVRKLLSEGEPAQQPKDGLSEQDRKFMEELYDLMDKHISEQDLNVSTISRDLLISHSKFNYKLKELTGETPGSFFRKFKLNRAAKLLREGKYNVSEVAMMTGFGTVSYFSVAFKKQFGVSPSEYK